MTNEIHSVEKVADIVKVLKGGIEFYQTAMEKVESHGAKTVFGRMISAKQESIEKLQPFAIAENGEMETGTSLSVDARKLFTIIAGELSGDSDHTYISQLEEVEDKTLAVIRDALEEKQPNAVNMVLMEVLASAQDTHNQMKSLQKSTA